MLTAEASPLSASGPREDQCGYAPGAPVIPPTATGEKFPERHLRLVYQLILKTMRKK